MKVSVVIPCYNGEAFIGPAIESVLQQSHRDLECLVVDDASKDSSVAIIAGYAERDSRVKGFLLKKNGGASAARNRALEAATGDWIAFLDADDLYKPDRLERLLALAAETGADMVADDQDVCDFPDTRLQFHAFRFLTGKTQPVLISQELFLRELAVFVSPFTLTPGYMKPMVRRAFLEKHRLRFNVDFRSGEDAILYIEALAWGALFFGTGYSGYQHRRRVSSVSRSGADHLRTHAALSDLLIAAHHERLSAASKATLRRRKRVFAASASLHELKIALMNRKFSEALKVAVRNPDFLTVTHHFAARALLRLSRGSR